MPYSVLVPRTFLSPDGIQLGRLVLNVNDPHSDYLDLGPVSSQDVARKSCERYIGQDLEVAAKSFSAILAHLLSASRSKQKGTATYITTERATTHELKNSGNWFEKALQLKETKDWIELMDRRGEDVYLVVGYHTVLDAHIYEAGSLYHSTMGQAALPIMEAMTAATGVTVPFSTALDPSFQVAQDQLEGGQQVFVAAGEQVAAVQYRKLQFKWYSSGALHDRPLGPSMWKSARTFRGTAEDTVEVTLQDELELETTGGSTSYLIEGNPFLLLSG